MQKEKQDLVIAIVTGSLFVVLFGIACFVVVVNYMRRKHALVLERETESARFAQQLLEAQLEMQEHTFRMVSQEIHDNVGQILSLAKLNLNIITLEQKENDSFHTIKELVGNAITELRDLGSGYYADRQVKEGLVLSIKHLADQLTRTGLFTTSFHSSLENIRLDKSKIIFLYRMVQESLNNIVKHSSATHVDIRIGEVEGKVHIVIKDNGKGFDSANFDSTKGIGLNSIKNRARMIEADAFIVSKPNSGTTVTLVFNA